MAIDDNERRGGYEQLLYTSLIASIFYIEVNKLSNVTIVSRNITIDRLGQYISLHVREMISWVVTRARSCILLRSKHSFQHCIFGEKAVGQL